MDGRAIEHLAVFKGIGLHGLGGEGDVVLFAQRVGKAQIDPAGVVLLEEGVGFQ